MKGFNGRRTTHDKNQAFSPPVKKKPDLIKVTDEAKLLSGYLWTVCKWPFTKAKLEREVQHSLDGLQRVALALSNHPDPTIKIKLATEAVVAYRHSMVKTHYMNVNDQIQAWRQWSGDMKQFRLGVSLRTVQLLGLDVSDMEYLEEQKNES